MANWTSGMMSFVMEPRRDNLYAKAPLPHITSVYISDDIAAYDKEYPKVIGEWHRLARNLASVEPFDVLVTGVDVFKTSVVLTVEHPYLGLVKSAAAYLPQSRTFPFYRPHITVGEVGEVEPETFYKYIGQRLKVRSLTITIKNDSTHYLLGINHNRVESEEKSFGDVERKVMATKDERWARIEEKISIRRIGRSAFRMSSGGGGRGGGGGDGKRRVRSPEGVARFGAPIGTIITPAMEAAADARAKAKTPTRTELPSKKPTARRSSADVLTDRISKLSAEDREHVNKVREEIGDEAAAHVASDLLKSGSKKPATEKPVAKKPATKKPAVKKPKADEKPAEEPKSPVVITDEDGNPLTAAQLRKRREMASAAKIEEREERDRLEREARRNQQISATKPKTVEQPVKPLKEKPKPEPKPEPVEEPKGSTYKRLEPATDAEIMAMTWKERNAYVNGGGKGTDEKKRRIQQVLDTVGEPDPKLEKSARVTFGRHRKEVGMQNAQGRPKLAPGEKKPAKRAGSTEETVVKRNRTATILQPDAAKSDTDSVKYFAGNGRNVELRFTGSVWQGFEGKKKVGESSTDRAAAYESLAEAIGMRAPAVGKKNMRRATPEEVEALKEKWPTVRIAGNPSQVWIPEEDITWEPDPHEALWAYRAPDGQIKYGNMSQDKNYIPYKKWERIKSVLTKHEHLNAQAMKDAPNNPHAAATLLMSMTGIRVASTDARVGAVKAYGATTLEKRHFSEVDGNAVLSFVAKGGKEVQYNLGPADEGLGRVVKGWADKQDSPTGKIFEGTSSSKTQQYIQEATDIPEHKNHDLRTALATQMASTMLAELQEANDPRFESKRGFRNIVKEVSEAVSEVLQNKPAQARDSYISYYTWANYMGDKEWGIR